jgi:ankyrin repeat protein
MLRYDGATALHAASANGDVLAMEALVKAGADVNHQVER